MKEIQFREAIIEAMSEEMRKDESIYLIGEEVAEYNGAYKASKGMLKEFGKNRIIDTPISEAGFTGIAIGSSMNGCRPIVEFMTFNFSLVAIDQIINNAAKLYQMSAGQFNCPIVFRGPTGAAGQLGATHSQSFDSWYANCPGLKVVVPSNPYDAKGLLKSSIQDNNPVIFMESEQMYGDKMMIPKKEYIIPIGHGEIKILGNDVTLVSYGKLVKIALQAAQKLIKEQIFVEVIDLRTIRPLDYDIIINSIKKTNRLIVLEESWPFGNISTEITYMVQQKAFDYLDAPIKRINTKDTSAPYAYNLYNMWYPNLDNVINNIYKILDK